MCTSAVFFRFIKTQKSHFITIRNLQTTYEEGGGQNASPNHNN